MSKVNTTPESNAINIIGSGTSITGDINSNGDVRIDGTLNGNLIIAGKVVVGQSGAIIGEVQCKNSDVSGTIKGKIKVKELLSLKSTAKIHGDIITSKLAIEPNAVFTGTCNMDGNSPIQQHGGKEPEKRSETED